MELYLVPRYEDKRSVLLTFADPRTTTGWSQEESETLRKALMKFGIGNWARIIESGCLPGKTNAQMNLQLQRLLGQQSTAGNVLSGPRVNRVADDSIQSLPVFILIPRSLVRRIPRSKVLISSERTTVLSTQEVRSNIQLLYNVLNAVSIDLGKLTREELRERMQRNKEM